jgi:hypothetical protein
MEHEEIVELQRTNCRIAENAAVIGAQQRWLGWKSLFIAPAWAAACNTVRFFIIKLRKMKCIFWNY